MEAATTVRYCNILNIDFILFTKSVVKKLIDMYKNFRLRWTGTNESSQDSLIYFCGIATTILFFSLVIRNIAVVKVAMVLWFVLCQLFLHVALLHNPQKYLILIG